jgi:hypothetical protein
MNRQLLVSFVLLVLMVFVMRWQGSSLVTPQSPKGIIDLEFAKTADRYHQLQLFWNPQDVKQNIYLDFLFIIAYTWFLVTACKVLGSRSSLKRSNVFAGLAMSAGAFDVLENFLMLLVLNGKFSTSVLQIVYYCAAIKFILAGIVVLYLILSLPSIFRRKAVN